MTTMRTTMHTTRRILCLFFCILLVMTAFSATAQAAPKHQGPGPKEQQHHSFHIKDNHKHIQDNHKHGKADHKHVSHNQQKDNAADRYFASWSQEAKSLGIKINQGELNKLADLYRAKGNNENFILKMVDWTNAKIDQQIAMAQRSPKDDVAQLMIQCDFLVANAVYWANDTGYELECIYEPYEVDGQTVYIDPLRVVNRRR